SMIEQYLKTIGLTFITDSSNAVNDVARNRLRNIVLPALYSQFPDGADAILRSMSVLADNERLIYATAAKARMQYFHNGTLQLTTLIADWGTAAHAMLYELLAPFGFNSTGINDLIAASAHPGARIESRTHVAEIGRGTASVMPIELTGHHSHAPGIKLERITPQQFCPARNHNMAWFDASVIDEALPLRLRPWRHGDRMKPFGMKGSRLLSDIFTDARIDAADKRNIWVLTRGEDILWVPGIRASRLFPVTDRSSSIIQLTLTGCDRDIPADQ
ncbi:MAG: tRNA lysidine(34) synthetase TilS, partial [Muribaculaceae bacterium]|nr:tRNA lysidine(34) synthetase TilS [Muribaculaceae bacterium]